MSTAQSSATSVQLCFCARSGSRRVTVERYVDVFVQRQQEKIGHPNPKLRRSRNSVELDQQRLKKFVLGTRLARMKLGEVKIRHVRDFVADLYKLRKANGEEYAQNTLRDVFRVLGALFREAGKDGLVARNPMRELDRDEKPSSYPRRPKRLPDPRADRHVPDRGRHDVPADPDRLRLGRPEDLGGRSAWSGATSTSRSAR